MDISQKLTMGMEVTGLGLLVVFVCLALIIVLIVLLSKLAKDKKKTPLQKIEVPSQVVNQAQAEPDINDDEELAAVLSAAVAAYLESDQNYDGTYKIKSFKRINDKSAWGNAGKRAQIFNKF